MFVLLSGLCFFNLCRIYRLFCCMKRIILFCILLYHCFSLSAQYERAVQWEEKIQELRDKNRKEGIKQGCVLFIGSSTFTRWGDAQKYFPNSVVVNRAFGGSMMCDQIYFFDEVIKPFNPSQIVIYEGDNDLNGTLTTPEQFMEDVICMSRLIHYHYPKCKILLVSIKPCPARVQSFDKYKKANLLMEKYAVLYDYIDFVSVWNKFVDENDRPIMKYFMDDQIHITPEAYLLFK